MSNLNQTQANVTFGEAFGFPGINVPLSALAPMGDGTNVKINHNFVFDKDVVKQVAFSISEGINLLLWGDAGAGKTDLIEQVAARFNRKAFILSFGEETSVRQLVGSFALSGGETPWRDGALLSAIRTEGAVIGLDEINMAPPGVVAMLNHLLQKRDVVIPETGEVVECAKGVAFIATSNTNMGVDESGLFEGSQAQNAATRSRFAGVHVKYLKEVAEMRLINLAYPDLENSLPDINGRSFASLTVQLAGSLRAATKEGGLTLPFTVRQMHQFIKATLAFKDITMGYKFAYWSLLDSVERQTAGDIFKTIFNTEIKED